MRIKELFEGKTGSIQDDVAEAIPATFVIPDLANQDPYKQYRFGVALADARSRKAKDMQHKPRFNAQSAWGENAIITSYSNTTKDIIDDALRSVGLGPGTKKQITSTGSNESSDVNTSSPVARPRKNRYGV